jgi:hypothetical protein
MPDPEPARATKTERRRAAREHAESIRREAEAKQRNRRLAVIAGTGAALATLLIVAAIGISNAQDDDSSTQAGSGAVSGLGAAAAPPWPLPPDATDRVAAAGMDTGPMGMTEHYHAHLDIIVNGEAVPVPANLGIDPATGGMAALHTHTADGLVHVEADTQDEAFTLGQLFTAWDVKLTAEQIGSMTTTDGNELKVYVNGEEQSGNPAMLRLADQQQITIVFGDQQVDIPDTYDFNGV